MKARMMNKNVDYLCIVGKCNHFDSDFLTFRDFCNFRDVCRTSIVPGGLMRNMLLYAFFLTSSSNALNSNWTAGSSILIEMPVRSFIANRMRAFIVSTLNILRFSRSSCVPHTNDE